MSFNFSAVSFILEGFAVAGAGLVADGAGAAVWAEAVWRLPATSRTAARQILVRSMEIPLKSYFFDGLETAREPRDSYRPAVNRRRAEYLARAFQRLPHTPGERDADERPEQRGLGVEPALTDAE